MQLSPSRIFSLINLSPVAALAAAEQNNDKITIKCFNISFYDSMNCFSWANVTKIRQIIMFL